MTKQLENINLFVKGDPAKPKPSIAYMTYDVASGSAKKTNNVHQIKNPNFTKTGEDFWNKGVSEIKAIEGISKGGK